MNNETAGLKSGLIIGQIVFTYFLSLWREYGFRYDLGSPGKFCLFVVGVPPMTDAELVHGIQIEDPIQNIRRVAKECCVVAHHPEGDRFDETEEHDPAEWWRLHPQSLGNGC